MCERLKQAVLKTAVPERVPGVRIPLPPPRSLNCRETLLPCLGNTRKRPDFRVPLVDPLISSQALVGRRINPREFPANREKYREFHQFARVIPNAGLGKCFILDSFRSQEAVVA